MARSVEGTAGVTLLPAPSGIGSPWYRPGARMVIAGLTAATDRRHVVRAALDSIAHRVADIVEAMGPAIGGPIRVLRADGGLSANDFLCQRQADLLGIPVDVASSAESTARGIAALASTGLDGGPAGPVLTAERTARRYRPTLPEGARLAERTAWRTFVNDASRL